MIWSKPELEEARRMAAVEDVRATELRREPTTVYGGTAWIVRSADGRPEALVHIDQGDAACNCARAERWVICAHIGAVLLARDARAEQERQHALLLEWCRVRELERTARAAYVLGRMRRFAETAEEAEQQADDDEEWMDQRIEVQLARQTEWQVS